MLRLNITDFPSTSRHADMENCIRDVLKKYTNSKLLHMIACHNIITSVFSLIATSIANPSLKYENELIEVYKKEYDDYKLLYGSRELQVICWQRLQRTNLFFYDYDTKEYVAFIDPEKVLAVRAKTRYAYPRENLM